MRKIAILGGGSWGTALAIVLTRSHRPHDIFLWVHNARLAEDLRRERENKTYLPGHAVPQGVQISSDIAAAVGAADTVVMAVPSSYARGVLTEALPHLRRESAVVSATKGLEPSTHLRMTEVIAQVCGAKSDKVAVLSGPSFAQEAARGEPTAVVIASRDDASPAQKIKEGGGKLAAELQEEFAGPAFRLYTNSDVLGVELAGAMKNVMAIAAGACQGLGLGSNAAAALITRGLAEMSRLAVALGARQETLSGLAGLGDLVLTCTGSLSRNRHVGLELGKGRTLKEILANMQMVAEGVGTTAALLALASETQIELPITEQVNAILHCGKAPSDAIREIMERPLKRE